MAGRFFVLFCFFGQGSYPTPPVGAGGGQKSVGVDGAQSPRRRTCRRTPPRRSRSRRRLMEKWIVGGVHGRRTRCATPMNETDPTARANQDDDEDDEPETEEKWRVRPCRRWPRAAAPWPTSAGPSRRQTSITPMTRYPGHSYSVGG